MDNRKKFAKLMDVSVDPIGSYRLNTFTPDQLVNPNSPSYNDSFVSDVGGGIEFNKRAVNNPAYDASQFLNMEAAKPYLPVGAGSDLIPEQKKSFGNAMARFGGFNNPLTPEQFANMSPTDIDRYNVDKKDARMRGMGEVALIVHDLFKNKNASEGFAERKNQSILEANEKERLKKLENYKETAFNALVEQNRASGMSLEDAQKDAFNITSDDGIAKLIAEGIVKKKYGIKTSNDTTNAIQNYEYGQNLIKQLVAGGMKLEDAKKDERVLQFDILSKAKLGLDYKSQQEIDRQNQIAIDKANSAGLQAVNKAFAASYEDYTTNAEYAKNIDKLNKVDNALQSLLVARKDQTTVSGPMVAMLMESFPNVAAGFFPEGMAIQEAIGAVTQLSLKEILGGQFSEREGLQLIKRGYNPALGTPENTERVLFLQNQIVNIAKDKDAAFKYYESTIDEQGNAKSQFSMDGYSSPVRDYDVESEQILKQYYETEFQSMSQQELEDTFVNMRDGFNDEVFEKAIRAEINSRK